MEGCFEQEEKDKKIFTELLSQQDSVTLFVSFRQYLII